MYISSHLHVPAALPRCDICPGTYRVARWMGPRESRNERYTKDVKFFILLGMKPLSFSM